VSLFRLLLWALLAFIVLRIVRAGMSIAKWKSSDEENRKPDIQFPNAEETDFEDLTSKEPDDKPPA
jgi:hypothetical protein